MWAVFSLRLYKWPTRRLYTYASRRCVSLVLTPIRYFYSCLEVPRLLVWTPFTGAEHRYSLLVSTPCIYRSCTYRDWLLVSTSFTGVAYRYTGCWCQHHLLVLHIGTIVRDSRAIYRYRLHWAWVDHVCRHKWRRMLEESALFSLRQDADVVESNTSKTSYKLWLFHQKITAWNYLLYLSNDENLLSYTVLLCTCTW